MMVVNDEILSGLRAALERGQSLKDSMLSFFNAGYDKTEIEEAAKALVEMPIEKPVQAQPSQPIQTSNTQPLTAKPKQIFASGKVIQKVSGYGKRSMGNKMIIIVLALLLFMLVATLIGIFVFKNDIVNWLNNVF